MTSIIIIIVILILLIGGYRLLFGLLGGCLGGIVLLLLAIFKQFFGGKILNFSGAKNFNNFDEFFSQNFNQNFNPEEFKKNYISLLGKIAKLDGLISPEEARFLSRTLDHLSSSASERIYLKKAYQAAILEPQNYEQNAQNMAKFCGRKSDLQKALIALLQLAIIDGLSQNKVQALKNCANCWHLSYMLEQIFAQNGFSGGQNRANYSQNFMSKKEALEILNLSEGASEAQIKQAYRKLAKEYHPDAQSSKNLSEKELEQITEKFRKINEAYEYLKKNP